MTDDGQQYYSAWVAVFGLGPRKLLCTWHVDSALRGAINAIKVKKTAATVYHNIRTLMEESDANKFKIMLQKTMEQLKWPFVAAACNGVSSSLFLHSTGQLHRGSH